MPSRSQRTSIMTTGVDTLPPFRAPYAAADEDIAAGFLAGVRRDAAGGARIDARAGGLIAAIRARSGGLGGIEDFLREYSLTTGEGLALMVLAEALLRVPDAATADRLIEDKLAAADWSHHEVHSTALLVSASALALGLSARPRETSTPAKRRRPSAAAGTGGSGRPVGPPAAGRAMRLRGALFGLGQTTEGAPARARRHGEFRYSFDMLGEGARTAADAARY